MIDGRQRNARLMPKKFRIYSIKFNTFLTLHLCFSFFALAIINILYNERNLNNHVKKIGGKTHIKPDFMAVF